METIAEFPTPNGNRIKMYCRDGTSDRAIAETIILGNEYRIPTHYEGVGVDIGAHIGAWTLAAIADNPGLAVIAIEAVYENVLLMQRSVHLNGWANRIKVLYRAASSSNRPVPIRYAFTGDTYREDNRFVGNLDRGEGEVQMVQGIRLTRLARLIGEPIRIMKIDCEGCEWRFLRSEAVGRIVEIVGEYHDSEPDNIEAMLSPTHHVSIQTNLGGIGLFRATHR